MSNEQIEKLAREYAEWLYPEEVALMENGEASSLSVDVVEQCEAEFLTALRFILRTHCIVPKVKEIEEYEGWERFLGTKDEPAAKVAMWQIEELFGADLFNENDNGLRD